MGRGLQSPPLGGEAESSSQGRAKGCSGAAPASAPCLCRNQQGARASGSKRAKTASGLGES